MPKMNMDEMVKTLFEPIEVIIDGVEYAVGKVTADTLKLDEVGEDADAGGHQLAKILGAKPTTFDTTDIRIVGAALKFVTDEIVKQMGASVKNSPVAGDTASA